MREKLIELLNEGAFQAETLCMARPDRADCDKCPNSKIGCQYVDIADCLIANGVTVLPCKIGDTAWAIRNHTGHLHPHRGIVSEMYFIKGMKLHIVVQNVARGEWGKTIFGTYEEAERAIEERKQDYGLE